MNVKAIIEASKTTITKHAPGILTGFAIAGLCISSYLWATETPKAQERIKKAEEAKGEKLSKTEKVKAAAPAYIPAAVSTAGTAITMFMAHKISAKQMAALLAAYQLSEDKLTEWKENTLKTVGQKKTDDIEENIARSRMSQVPVTEDGIINTGKGQTLYFDSWSGRYFWSDRQFLKEVEIDLNDIRVTNNNDRRLIDPKDITLNDFYDMVGLDEIKHGDDWIFNDPIKLKYTAIMHPTLNMACTQIDFYDEPVAIPF